MKAVISLAALALSCTAFAETTGPGATLYKLDDRWVSIKPDEAAPVVVSAAPAVEAAPVVEAAPEAPSADAALASIPGYTPDSNYSGVCHVTADLASKTYVVNETSSTTMVNEVGAGKACLPTERLALDNGFTKDALSR